MAEGRSVHGKSRGSVRLVFHRWSQEQCISSQEMLRRIEGNGRTYWQIDQWWGKVLRKRSKLKKRRFLREDLPDLPKASQWYTALIRRSIIASGANVIAVALLGKVWARIHQTCTPENGGEVLSMARRTWQEYNTMPNNCQLIRNMTSTGELVKRLSWTLWHTTARRDGEENEVNNLYETRRGRAVETYIVS